MGGPKALSTTPTTVRLHEISVKYPLKPNTKAFPTVWDSLVDPVKDVMGFMTEKLERKVKGGQRHEERRNTAENIVETTTTTTWPLSSILKERVIDTRESTTKSVMEKGTVPHCESGYSNQKALKRLHGIKRQMRKQKVETVIALQELSTILEPSQIHLVLGGAKSGKSSLLQVNEGRVGGRRGRGDGILKGGKEV